MPKSVRSAMSSTGAAVCWPTAHARLWSALLSKRCLSECAAACMNNLLFTTTRWPAHIPPLCTPPLQHHQVRSGTHTTALGQPAHRHASSNHQPLSNRMESGLAMPVQLPTHLCCSSLVWASQCEGAAVHTAPLIPLQIGLLHLDTPPWCISCCLNSTQEREKDQVLRALPLSPPSRPLLCCRYMWPVPMLQQLAMDREVIIYDLMGSGGSNMTGAAARVPLTIEAMADSTAALLTKLGLPKVDVWRCEGSQPRL